jgi:orotate phosphoribosyltransferase-like protein
MSATDEPKGFSETGLNESTEPSESARSQFNLGLIAKPEPAPTPALIGLLRDRPTLNRKRTISFLSIRKWPVKNRDTCISMLKDAKDRADLVLVNAIADDIAHVIAPWFKLNVTVTAPPAGVKRPHHFASLVAAELAGKLNFGFRQVFESRQKRTSSYPKKDEERGDMQIAPHHVIEGHWILIDDVSSSGSTLETATHALIARGAHSVLPICWIYGSVKDDRPAEGLGELDG